MKKLVLILFMFVTSFTFAQTYELSKDASLTMDSTLTTIFNDTYSSELSSDRSNINFYDKRIQDILIKYYHVIDNETNINAINKWIESSFHPALDAAIKTREKFIKNN